jgi:hypothetical protein
VIDEVRAPPRLLRRLPRVRSRERGDRGGGHHGPLSAAPRGRQAHRVARRAAR